MRRIRRVVPGFETRFELELLADGPFSGNDCKRGRSRSFPDECHVSSYMYIYIYIYIMCRAIAGRRRSSFSSNRYRVAPLRVRPIPVSPVPQDKPRSHASHSLPDFPLSLTRFAHSPVDSRGARVSTESRKRAVRRGMGGLIGGSATSR